MVVMVMACYLQLLNYEPAGVETSRNYSALLFVCSFFNDAFSDSDYITSNERVIK
jgi:hypothetical protein